MFVLGPPFFLGSPHTFGILVPKSNIIFQWNVSSSQLKQKGYLQAVILEPVFVSLTASAQVWHFSLFSVEIHPVLT